MRAWVWSRKAIATLAAAILAVAGWSAVATTHNRAMAAKGNTGQTASSQEAASINYANQLSDAFRSASERALQSVVMIQVTTTVSKPMRNQEQGPGVEPGNSLGDLFRDNPQLRQFFKQYHFQTPQNPEQTEATGSGVILDPSGWILTNNHVVQGAGQVTVELKDGRTFKATDIHRDPTSDLAILKIHADEPLPAAHLGSSSHVQVGDWVLALGEPFGLQGTVTAGIISATGRNVGITSDGGLLQTDAAINPGNSGGPLVNLEGQVVGINTAISTESGGNEGIGFAIPIDRVKWVVHQLQTSGMVQRAYLGAMIQSVNQDLARQFGVKVHQGVLISEIMPNTPAAAAGVKAGDIVTTFAGKRVTTPEELREQVEMSKVGSSQPLVVIRNGKEITLTVALQPRPKSEEMAGALAEGEGQQHPSTEFDKLGFDVAPLTPDVASQLGVKARQGLVITSVQPNSPADHAGLTEGVVITQADRMPVKTAEDLQKLLKNAPSEKGLLLLVQTSEGAHFVVLHPVQ